MENKLSHLIDYFEIQPEILCSYFDRETGDIFTVSKDDRLASEATDDYPVDDIFITEQSLVPSGAMPSKRDLTSNRYVLFPEKYDFDDYNAVESFIESIEDEFVKQDLHEVLRGSGVVGKFQYAIIQFDLDYEWHEYRKDAVKGFIKSWCRQNNIEIEDDTEEG